MITFGNNKLDNFDDFNIDNRLYNCFLNLLFIISKYLSLYYKIRELRKINEGCTYVKYKKSHVNFVNCNSK